MAGYSKIYCIGDDGWDGINPIYFQILVEDAGRVGDSFEKKHDHFSGKSQFTKQNSRKFRVGAYGPEMVGPNLNIPIFFEHVN